MDWIQMNVEVLCKADTRTTFGHDFVMASHAILSALFLAACCLCDISCLFVGDLWNGEQYPGSPMYTPALTKAPLSRSSRELFVNST